MALAERADLAVRLTLDDRQFSGGIRRAQGALGGLGRSAGRVGKGVGQIGTGLARAGLLVGGAAVGGLTAVAKAAVDFEDAFAGVRKTVNEADLTAAGLSFDKLAQTFRDMATDVPIAATEFARLGETAGALGVKAQDIDDFVKTTALLGVTTNLSADAAAESLGKLGTILGLTGKDYQEFADVLVNLGNQGASTESEIIEVAKRFSAIGRQAGLTNEQILALSSSITSLGAEPEAGGSALSRIFANMSTEIANGTKKGKEFAEVTGDSLDELRRRINKGDALGIVLETLDGISGLSRTKAASVLKALGITNVRDRNAILLMAQNLGFVNDQLGIAEQSAGALGREAEKRFSTVASKLKLVKNNAIEVAIAMGSEMLPAIGRAADKAVAFLKDPETKAAAIQLGKDVGKFIDDIDWNKVKDGALALKDAMKGAVDFTLALLSALDKLPNEIKGAAVGFLALNKLSGGLIGAGIGNVVGGLAGAVTRGLASRAPGVGRLFAQPVFVTNWPMGGLGGAGGLAGGKGKFGGPLGFLGLASIGTAVGLMIPDILAGLGIADPVKRFMDERRPGPAHTDADGNVVIVGVAPSLRNGLFGPDRAPKPGTPITRTGHGSTQTAEEKRSAINWERIKTNTDTSNNKLTALQARIREARIAQVAASERVRSTTRAGDNSIVAAIRGIQRPIVSVSVVGNTVRTVYRTGGTVTRNVSTGSMNAGLLT